MKVMILAAGRGERLRPLTDTIPKALVEVQGRPLIEHHILRLAAAGLTDIVINLAYLGEKIEAYLGNGERLGVTINYSKEALPGLETGGGIVNALPLLGKEPFLVINTDIFCDYDFKQLPVLGKALCHLVLVNNPAHNPDGDFDLLNGQLLLNEQHKPYTYAGIALYSPQLFEGQPIERYSVVGLIKQAIKQSIASAECFTGSWHDIGTQQRLDKANSGY